MLFDLLQVSLEPLFTLSQLLLASFMFSYYQPKRNNFYLRAIFVALCLIGMVLSFSWIGFIHRPELTSTHLVPTQFVTFSATLVLSVGVIWMLYDVSLRTALFCATAGYTVQNMASGLEQSALLALRGSALDSPLMFWFVPLATTLLVFVLAWWILARRIQKQGLVEVENISTVCIFAFVILINIGFDLVVKTLPSFNVAASYIITLRIVHLVTCVFILMVEWELIYNSRLKHDMLSAQLMVSESERQYQISKDTIEAINLKCHDLRHQIRTLATQNQRADADMLATLERDIEIYDATVKTGNEALDVILTEKRLLCSSENIVLSVIADGGALAFMQPAELLLALWKCA